MRVPTRTSVAALIAALSVTMTGCGGGGGGNSVVNDENRPYVDALVESLQESTSEDEIPLSDDQASCMAPRFVNIIGVDRLKDNGITPEEFASDDDTMDFSDFGMTKDDGNALYDTFGDCGISLRDMMLESFADEDMSPEAVTCMESALTDDNIREFMVASMIQGQDALEDEPELASLMGQLMTCAFLEMDEG